MKRLFTRYFSIIFSSRTLFLTLIILFSNYAKGQQTVITKSSDSGVIIGKNKVFLPSPVGYTIVTSDMTTLYNFQLRFVPETNKQLAYYIPTDQIPSALKGEAVETTRAFRVQLPKALENLPSPASELFPQFKEYFKKNHEELLKAVAAKIPDALKKTNEELASTFKYNPALTLSNVIPIKEYEETEYYLITSMFTKYSKEDKSSKETFTVVSMTMTLIRVKDSIFVLYAYGSDKDMEWTRTMSKQWAKAIHTQNL